MGPYRERSRSPRARSPLWETETEEGEEEEEEEAEQREEEPFVSPFAVSQMQQLMGQQPEYLTSWIFLALLLAAGLDRQR
jgi:hypothetical protein